MTFAPGGVEQSCRVCRKPGNDDLRARWGCDEPTPYPQFLLDCPTCEGKHAECDDCRGIGRIEYRDCPFRHVTQRELDVCTAAVLIEQTGILPASGGWFEQSAVFLDAVSIVLREKAKYDEARQERHARQMRAAHG